MAEVRVSRRHVLKVAAATGIATTSPWWLVNKSHAQRAKKLIFWQLPNFTPIADQLQKDQVYEFAKSAGLKEEEVEFSVVGNDVYLQKLSAALEAGNVPMTSSWLAGLTLSKVAPDLASTQRPPIRFLKLVVAIVTGGLSSGTAGGPMRVAGVWDRL